MTSSSGPSALRFGAGLLGHYSRAYPVSRVAELGALCERLGMRLESQKRGDFWSKGVWTDSLEYALLADEWHAGRG